MAKECRWGEVARHFRGNGQKPILLLAAEGGYSFSYLEDGFKRTLVVYPRGVKEIRGYDTLTRMTNLVYKKWLTALLLIGRLGQDLKRRGRRLGMKRGMAIELGGRGGGVTQRAVAEHLGMSEHAIGKQRHRLASALFYSKMRSSARNIVKINSDTIG